MENLRKFNTKKVVIYSCLSLTFGLLSFFSYNNLKKDEPKEPLEVIFEVVKTRKNNEKPDNSNQDLEQTQPLDNAIEEVNKISIQIISIHEITGKYITVIGTFRQKNNALSLCKSMVLSGYEDCKVIYNGTSLYWVSFKNYTSLKDAKNDIINYNLDGWIKKI